MRVLDLFCGAGGFSLGFASPANTVIGVDSNAVAITTYTSNMPRYYARVEGMCMDVRGLDLATIGHVDVLIGSPPCQTFSGLNIRGSRVMDAALIHVYENIRDELRPRYWVMEESPFAAPFVERWCRRFMRACDHGLYHVRRRLFAGNYPTVQPTRPVRAIHPTATAEEVKAFKSTARFDRKHAKNLMTWFGHHMHPWEVQVLMGYPSEYEFHGTIAEQLRQIGNSVCPPVARAIYMQIEAGMPPIARQERLTKWLLVKEGKSEVTD